MTEQSPDPQLTTPIPGTVEQTTPLEPTERELELESRLAAAEQAAATALEATGQAPRYAIYDNTYLRFVGAVLDKRPTPAAAKKAVGHDNYEIREV